MAKRIRVRDEKGHTYRMTPERAEALGYVAIEQVEVETPDGGTVTETVATPVAPEVVSSETIATAENAPEGALPGGGPTRRARSVDANEGENASTVVDPVDVKSAEAAGEPVVENPAEPVQTGGAGEGTPADPRPEVTTTTRNKKRTTRNPEDK